MPLKDKFVRVRSRTRTEIVGDEIAGHGFPLAVADRIADHLVRAECLPADGQLRQAVQGLFWNLYEEWSKKPDPDILTMLIFRAVVGHEYGTHLRRVFQEEPWRLDQGKSNRFAAQCAQDDGFDFTAALDKTVAFLNAAGEKFSPGLDMAQVLWRQGLVEPERLIDPSQLVALAKSTSIYGGSWSSIEEQLIRMDVRAPAFWIAVSPDAAIRGLAPAIKAASDEDLAWLARGINICANRSLSVSGFTTTPPPVREVTRFAFDAVDARVGDKPREALPLLRHTWLHLWRELHWGPSRIEQQAARNARLLAAADLELGTLRPIIERADQAAFTERLPAFSSSITCMFEIGPLWDGIRSLLLAFRKLPMPGVAADLRWWSDTYHKQPHLPEPWHQIASELVSSFHAYAKKEQDNDADLEALRTAFARFCLDRLKTRENGDGPREDNPLWRLGYIDAVLALRINPDGKGHHTLHHSAEHDPEPEVKAAAKAAYNVLRHGPTLKGESPRRSVLLAFWHPRQSHLAALGVPIDERGANRIREEEVRRTTEQEQHEQTYAEKTDVSPPSGPETGPSLV